MHCVVHTAVLCCLRLVCVSVFFPPYQSHMQNQRVVATPSLEELSTPFKVIGTPRLPIGHTVFCVFGLF